MSVPTAAVKVPQILNAALAAAVFICLAQRTPELIKLYPSLSSTELTRTSALIALIIAYNLKQIVDEYRAFEFGSNENFSLAPTVVFGALSYLMLAIAASNVGDVKATLYSVIGYFVVLTVWSLVSLIRRLGYKDSNLNVDKLRRRMLWACSYGASILILLLIHIDIIEPFSNYLFLLIPVLYFYDVRDSKTFVTAHEGGV